ncbi:hypothetical protein BVX97_05490 [bacterium E08(2017)]|nr:hypothetical protein BVX97_05490 [bacterium E08(2017)]
MNNKRVEGAFALLLLMLALVPVVWACWQVSAHIEVNGVDIQEGQTAVFGASESIDLEMVVDPETEPPTYDSRTWEWSSTPTQEGNPPDAAIWDVGSLAPGQHAFDCTVTYSISGQPPQSDDDSVTFYVIKPTLSAKPSTLSLCTCSETKLTLDIGEAVSIPSTDITWDKTAAPKVEDKPVLASLVPGRSHFEKVLRIKENSAEGEITITANVETASGHYESATVIIDVVLDGCTACDQAGNVANNVNSIDSKIYMGKTKAGEAAGYMRIKSDVMSAVLATPSGLEAVVLGNGEGVEVINYNSEIRQILAPQGLFDVVTVSSTAYDLNFYEKSQVGDKDAHGNYLFTGDAVKTITVKNPSGNPADYDKLQVIEAVDGDSITNEYHYDGSDWTLIEGNGLRTEILSEAVNGDYKTKTRTIKNPDGTTTSPATSSFAAGALVPMPTLPLTTVTPWTVMLLETLRPPSTVKSPACEINAVAESATMHTKPLKVLLTLFIIISLS